MWKAPLVVAGLCASAALLLVEQPELASASPAAHAPEGEQVAGAAVALSSSPVAGGDLLAPAEATPLSTKMTASRRAAAREQNPWPLVAKPAAGRPLAIGGYSAGCLQGAEPLPLDGAGFQVMHPSRRRYFGHPELVDYITKLGERVHDRGLGVLLVGDLSQPRGGRAADGHSSHQIGLDVDVYFWRPDEALTAPLALEVRDQLEAPSILEAGDKAIAKRWKAHVAGMLRAAVDDPRVERVFVHPSIKRELCEASASDRGWLRKIRPWHGHDDHFHARLACPADDSACQGQAPLPPGDGCDQLSFWFDTRAKAARRQALSSYKRNVREGNPWPLRCEALLQ